MSKYKKIPVTIRFEVEELSQIDELCQELGLSRQQYIRNVSIGDISEVKLLQQIGLFPLVKKIRELKEGLSL